MLDNTLIGSRPDIICDVLLWGGMIILFKQADHIGTTAETYHYTYFGDRYTLIKHQFDCMLQPDLLDMLPDGLTRD